MPSLDARLADAGPPAPGPGGPQRAWRCLPRLLTRLGATFGVTEAELTQGSRRRPVAAARAAMGAVAVTGLGLPAGRVGGALGVTGMAILRGLARRREHLRRHGLAPEPLARELLRKGD